MGLFAVFTVVAGLWVALGWRALGVIWADMRALDEERRQEVRGSLKKYKDLYYDEG